MSEVLQRYLPPDPDRLPVATPSHLLGWAMALASDLRVQFYAMVVVPTAAAAIYYGLLAAPQYVSHVEYVVRGVDSHRSSGLASLLNTFGISRAADETSAIESFLKSREVVEKLNARVDLRAVYGADAADRLARFPRFWERDSFENLYAFTRKFIGIFRDPSNGVTRLDIVAYDPASAEKIAAAMIDLASDMANSLNARAQTDTVQAAKRDLEESRDGVVKVQSELTAFRNEALLVDPLAFAGAMLQGIGALSLERARTQAQIAETERLSPNNPGIDSMKASVAALEHKIQDERGKLAGDNSARAGKVANYERLTLMRDLAEKRYAAALVSLQTAQADAERKRIYIEEIVKPNLPDEPTAPERFRNVLSVFVVGFICFSIFWILSVGSKDHAQ